MQGRDWHSRVEGGRLHYRDAKGSLNLPLPALPGAHQIDNAALAIAMMRHAPGFDLPELALASAMTEVRWPARLQKLRHGPLVGEREVWLDGGHNAQAAEFLASTMAALAGGRGFHLITGMLTTKDAEGLLAPFRGLAAEVHAVPFDHPLAVAPDELAAAARSLGLAATPRESVAKALALVPQDNPILIAGSLYLAGEVLSLNDEVPD
jgi:dihydrofolate synthase/folylpolyglutamate synthase